MLVAENTGEQFHTFMKLTLAVKRRRVKYGLTVPQLQVMNSKHALQAITFLGDVPSYKGFPLTSLLHFASFFTE